MVVLQLDSRTFPKRGFQIFGRKRVGKGGRKKKGVLNSKQKGLGGLKV